MLARHRHSAPFAAVVLSGSYVEAGDSGLHRVAAGDVILHRAFEGHVDRFGAAGAEVLTLRLTGSLPGQTHGRIADVDRIARLAERDAIAALCCLEEQWTPAEQPVGDWPELLALALIDDPDLSIAAWAEQNGLHPRSIARGFRQTFAVTAARFRANARALRVLDDVADARTSLAHTAAAHGYADQAHMTREVVALTGLSPARFRQLRQAGAAGK